MTYREITQLCLIKHPTADADAISTIYGQVCIFDDRLFLPKTSTPAHDVIFSDIQTAIARQCAYKLGLLTIFPIRLGRRMFYKA